MIDMHVVSSRTTEYVVNSTNIFKVHLEDSNFSEGVG